MKTSLNEISQAERYLQGNMKHEDALVFNARLLLDPVLRMSVSTQKKVYSLVRMYGRKKLRAELEVIHEDLFHDKTKHSFADRIMRLFNKSDK